MRIFLTAFHLGLELRHEAFTTENFVLSFTLIFNFKLRYLYYLTGKVGNILYTMYTLGYFG